MYSFRNLVPRSQDVEAAEDDSLWSGWWRNEWRNTDDGKYAVVYLMMFCSASRPPPLCLCLSLSNRQVINSPPWDSPELWCDRTSKCKLLQLLHACFSRLFGCRAWPFVIRRNSLLFRFRFCLHVGLKVALYVSEWEWECECSLAIKNRQEASLVYCTNRKINWKT